MRSNSLPLLLLLSVLAACGEPEVAAPAAGSDRPARDQLSQAEASARKARVSQIAYVLDIDLVTLGDAYQGVVAVEFQLTDNAAPLEIDFTGGSVSAVVVNGQALAADYNGFFITLPASALIAGSNTVTINYRHPFDQDGTGLHRFVDPEDNRTYLYTYLWPYYSNRLFPNFDQPNLKATYELTVRAANDWQVISAMREDSVTLDGDSSLWHFPQSALFSTYIFSLHAGPYQIWEDQAGDIPIRLLARQSLAPYVAADEWLTYTRDGLAHYRDYFDIPYPFLKYDQVIVPDFLIGAMENVAAVTFSESYVDRGAGTRFSSQRRANTILHEMAHMWFGDLVTKDWWNGLWLNESFATLMASIAVAESTEFDDQWHDFYLSENLTAIGADTAVSTHPIEMPVNSTSDFFTVFDDITYDKGASVLNQLSHFIGQENFRLGVSSYLKQHSYGNTELADFIYSLSVQSDIDLTPWAQDWLYSAGVNTLEARVDCDAGVVTSLSILQTADAGYPTLRDQRVQLGLFAENGAGDIEAFAAIPVVVSGAETPVPAAVGQACPGFVYPNYQAWGYTEVNLDATSIEYVIDSEALGKVQDPLLRSMIWTALIDATTNNTFDDAALVDMIIVAMGSEQNNRIIRQTQAALIEHLNLLERAATTELASRLHRFVALAESRLWEMVLTGVNASQSESRLNLQMGNYVELARSDAALENLVSLLAGSVTVPGLKVQPDLRWRIIHRLAERGHEAAPKLLAAEQQRDTSDAGRIAAIATEAALPDLAAKQVWVEQILHNADSLPFSHLRAAMGALFATGQEDLQLALLPQLTESLHILATERDAYFLQSYGRDLFYGVCSDEGLQILRTAIAEPAAIGPTLYKFMSENMQQAENCLAFGTVP